MTDKNVSKKAKWFKIDFMKTGKYRSQDQYFNFIDIEMFTDAGKSKNILITGIQTFPLKQLDVLCSVHILSARRRRSILETAEGWRAALARRMVNVPAKKEKKC